jgi:hypothetical protein
MKDLPEITICMGRPHEDYFNPDSWKGELWLFGDCVNELSEQTGLKKLSVKNVKGCPPHVLDLYKWFCSEYYGSGKK